MHQVLQYPPERYGDGHEEEYPGDEPCLGVDANLEQKEREERDVSALALRA